MAHLKCEHGRRVIVFSSGKQTHRNGDGSVCTVNVSINGRDVYLNYKGVLIREDKGV